jgi:exodeoxyribonuclease V alpha subunit
MRIVIQTILSERHFGVIVSARIDELGHPSDGELVRVKALSANMLGRPVPGEVWEIEGEVKNSNWGPQVEPSKAVRLLPTGKLVRNFLASHVPGVGPERAEALWKKFGMNLAEILSNDENLASIAEVIAPDRPSFGPHLAAACIRAYRDAASEARTVMWLAEKGVEDVNIARRVVLILGDEAIQRLETNPYLLTSLLPWDNVDKLSLRLLHEIGVYAPHQDVRRYVGAVDAAVRMAISEGHTAILNERLRLTLAKCLGVSEKSQFVNDAIAAGERNGAVIQSPAGWRAPGCAVMEDAVIARFRRMLAADYPRPVPMPSAETVETLLSDFEVRGRPLHDEQRAAVIKILHSPLACLQGGAGVGKTSTTKAVCDLWEDQGGHLLLCTIAGRAALRLSRSTSRLAVTIARLLAQLRERERIAEQLADQELDNKRREKLSQRLSVLAELTPETLVIADEASMIDLVSIYGLLRFMPEGSRLLLVGDEAQLPPVNFGVIYHPLVEDDMITARLTVVHRQKESSGIPAVAAAIRAGRVPVFAPYAGRAEGVSIIEVPLTDTVESVERIWKELGGPEGEALIVTATNNGALGIGGLNKRLHDEHVNTSGMEEIKGYFGAWFTLGDPVVFLRNDYTKGLYNGLLGRVIDIDCETRSCIVQFDGYDEPHVIGTDDLTNLALAYAITCHRCQGSQAPAVVVPIYSNRIMDPSWIYTAITRAERQVVLVGSSEVLQVAMARPRAVDRRLVGFRWTLERSFQDSGSCLNTILEAS